MGTLERHLSQRQRLNAAGTRLDEIKESMDALNGRLQRVESLMGTIVKGVNKTFTDMNAKAEEQAEIMVAMLELLGTDKVEEIVAKNKIARATTDLNNQLERVKNFKEAGKLKAVETITAKSLLIAREVRADGEPIPPGGIVIAMTDIATQYQEKLKGQSVGVTIDTEVGGKFTVNEVYEAVDAEPASMGTAATDAASTSSES